MIVFIEAVIDEVDIDIIGGFTIVADAVEYYCPLVQKDIEIITIHNESIALDRLTNWERYYRLMGRTNRAMSIYNFLYK